MVNSEIRIIKKPTGSSFPAAKNLSKLEGDQVGNIVFEPDLSLIRAVLCSAALRIRMNTGHWLLEVENIRTEKSPHRCLHRKEKPAWAVIECVLHTPIIIR